MPRICRQPHALSETPSASYRLFANMSRKWCKPFVRGEKRRWCIGIKTISKLSFVQTAARPRRHTWQRQRLAEFRPGRDFARGIWTAPGRCGLREKIFIMCLAVSRMHRSMRYITVRFGTDFCKRRRQAKKASDRPLDIQKILNLSTAWRHCTVNIGARRGLAQPSPERTGTDI